MSCGKDGLPDASRRALLQGAGGLGVILLAPGVMLTVSGVSASETEPASAKKRWAMVIDLNKCQPGCDHCVTACDQENGLGTSERPDTDARWIRKVRLGAPSGRVSEIPVMCQHCASPACVDVCPTGASFKRADGIAQYREKRGYGG